MEDTDNGQTGEKPWLDPTPLPSIRGLPDYGWRVKFDHKHQEPCRPFTLPRWHQMRGLFGLSFRYAQAWFQYYWQGKKMFIDNLDLCPWRPIYGAPIGGIGCGTIGRGYRGEFCRFQMIPGMYKYNTVLADQFTVCIRKNNSTVYQQVLSPHRSASGALTSWNWGFPEANGTYHALYPRSWTVYDLPGQDVRLICRQVSPIFPHDYKDTSLPVAVFVWSIENTGDAELSVSIMFTFQSGQGDDDQTGDGITTESFSTSQPGQHGITGVTIQQAFCDMPCTYALSAKHSGGSSVTCCPQFDPDGNGQEVWMDLMSDGQLDGNGKDKTSSFSSGRAGAVCVQVTLAPGQTKDAEFCLSWDMPIVHFGGRRLQYSRRYARWYGTEGKASLQLASYALHKYPEWEDKISTWQDPIVNDSSLPAWYKSALFNELYFVSDGGTIWLDPYSTVNGITQPSNVPALIKEYSKFAYLEGHEYRMYNTYDVHHYASFALIMLWPKLQLSLQYDIGLLIPEQQTTQIKYLMDGTWGDMKEKDCVPHDIGDPDDDVWLHVNSYRIHPTHEWKDLNTKFILQYYRDYAVTGDLNFLKDLYPSAKAVMKNSLRWDTDGDGIIDNAGFADQTFDAWTMCGASAYCGGMWVAALKLFCEAAQLLSEHDDFEFFSAMLEKAKDAFEKKLWNGKYYNFDSSQSDHFDSCMSDQLSGHWFLKASNVPDDAVFPREHVLKALHSIFETNVMPYENGTMGAINGARPNCDKDITSCQSEEFWVGVTYGLAALMLHEGLDEMGYQTAYGSYHVCYERFGLHFQTPEAYFDDKRYRSLGYMRPLCIWAMQYALEKRKGQAGK